MFRRTTTAVLLALALIAAACATGGTPQAEGPSAAALTPTSVASSVATAQTGGGATSEGIQVHGHWTVEVRNADGTLDKQLQFENAITPLGARALAFSLLGTSVDYSSWYVGFTDNGCAPIDSTSTAPQPIPDNYVTWDDGPIVVPATSDLDDTYRGVRFEADGKITFFRTGGVVGEERSFTGVFSFFDGVVRPNTWGTTLTCHELDSPVTIDVDQWVHVEVEIGFS